MDNRRFSRVLFNTEAELIQQGHHYPTQLLDLSLKGALVARPHQWEQTINSVGTLRFRLAQSELELSMDVSIAHIHESSIGLRCELIDIDSASHLRRLLELNLGDSELLSRELSELSYQRHES